jgi:rsbT antagonist protein RsbS
MADRIPILRIEDILIASIQTSLDDQTVVRFQMDLLEMLSETGAYGVVIDVTAVDVVDSFMARSLSDLATAARLLGAQPVIVGLQPPVAITLVEMGLTIPGAATALDLERGLRMIREHAPQQSGGE